MKRIAVVIVLMATPAMAEVSSVGGGPPAPQTGGGQPYTNNPSNQPNTSRGYVLREKQCVFLGKVNEVDMWAGYCRPRDDAEPYLEQPVGVTYPTNSGLPPSQTSGGTVDGRVPLINSGQTLQNSNPSGFSNVTPEKK
jgi:hypothetical protein